MIHDVELNPLRAGLLDVLERMGVRVAVFNRRSSAARSSPTSQVRATPWSRRRSSTPRCRGSSTSCRSSRCSAPSRTATTEVTGAEELRAKETDRIETVTDGAPGDRRAHRGAARRLRVRGVPSRPRGGTIDAAGDHRIAMLGAIAGAVSREGVTIEGPEMRSGKLPRFLRPLRVSVDGIDEADDP